MDCELILFPVLENVTEISPWTEGEMTSTSTEMLGAFLLTFLNKSFATVYVKKALKDLSQSPCNLPSDPSESSAAFHLVLVTLNILLYLHAINY